MKFVIVTGMSGAGKSTALKTLEDMGFFCVDNLPILLIEKFAEIANDDSLDVDKVAVGIDIRNGIALLELSECLKHISNKKYSYEILFLDATDKSLVKRYKETRRTHPLSNGGRIHDGIRAERQKIEFLHEMADYIIDTTLLLTKELKKELEKIFNEDEEYNNIIVTFMSFGFKYGIPTDSDLVFDVRFLPNPYYDDILKPLTGDDKKVQDYVKNSKEYNIFMDKLRDMISFLVPNYKAEGKNQLVISIGCTGGKHRSVTVTNEIFELFNNTTYTTKKIHRDIMKDNMIKGD